MESNDDKVYAYFHYSGYNRNVTYHLKEFEADYLPRMLSVFAEYLRACGFVYVDVKPVDGGWMFTKDYDSNTDDDTWSRPEFSSELYDLDDDDEDQSEINQAAEDYWNEQVDKACAKCHSEDQINPGDTVFYHGKGTPETTPNELDEPQGHGGRRGVTLVNMKGRVIKVIDSPVGLRALVKWHNWNDGHNGMGDDPYALMGDQTYWWINVDNVSVSN